MMLSRFPKLSSRERSHVSSWLISIAATSEMVFPSILKYVVSLFSLVPPHSGQTIFSFMSLTIPENATISEDVPSPTLNSSSDPNTMSEITSSGSSSIGSYSENAYFLAMDLMMSNFLVSLILPNGTMPPSAIEMLLSGIMDSMFTSTMIPSPLQ